MKDYRADLEKTMRATLADEAAKRDWTYQAVRPMVVPVSWTPGQRVRGDCSKGVQFLCRWVGAPDPMKNYYSAYGNSTTLCAGLQHLDSLDDLEIGDLVTFGRNGDEHAAMVLELKKAKKRTAADVILWSFGHQGAPNSYPLSADHREYQLLRNPVPKYVPTPADRLRAKTDYWSWLQWKLGEGSWDHHDPGDPTVRPNVPKTIPLGWWRRYAHFLLMRRKGRANQPTTAALSA